MKCENCNKEKEDVRFEALVEKNICDNCLAEEEEKDETGMTKEREIAGEILDIFEDYLSDKGIEIPNEEKKEYGDTEDLAILFGTEYYLLEDKITELLEKLK